MRQPATSIVRTASAKPLRAERKANDPEEDEGGEGEQREARAGGELLPDVETNVR